MLSQHSHSIVKAGLDLSSIGVVASYWAGYLPAVATALTIIWVSYCIVEAVIINYHRFKNRNKVG